MKEDFYQILGIPRDANEEAIRRAYRKAVHRVHPDVSETPDVERLLKLQEAYETLSDPEKRKDYDRSLKQEARGHVSSSWEARVGPPRATSPWIEVILSPWEAINGLRIPLHLPLEIPCRRCGGVGWRGLFPCLDCGGSGAAIQHLTFFIQIPPGIQDGARLHIRVPNFGTRIWVLVRVQHP
jgi:DnaJ-class molecular chaperone